MIYLAASPFISNIAISFIAANLTLICFKGATEKRERAHVRLATDTTTFCTSHPRSTQCRRAVSWGGGLTTGLLISHPRSCCSPPLAKLPDGASHVWGFHLPPAPEGNHWPCLHPCLHVCCMSGPQGWTCLALAPARRCGYPRRLLHGQPVPGKDKGNVCPVNPDCLPCPCFPDSQGWGFDGMSGNAMFCLFAVRKTELQETPSAPLGPGWLNTTWEGFGRR